MGLNRGTRQKLRSGTTWSAAFWLLNQVLLLVTVAREHTSIEGKNEASGVLKGRKLLPRLETEKDIVEWRDDDQIYTD